MSGVLPPVDPGYAAEVIAALPSRLAGKLADVDSGEWEITQTHGAVAVRVGTATVTITGPTEASCDCLLAPRCLHLAGVLSAAPVSDPVAEPAIEPSQPAPETAPTRLTDPQRACCELAAATLTTALDQGLTVLTAPARAAILRVVSLARSAGLHRLGATFAGLHNALHSPTRRSVTHLRSAALAVQVLRHGDATGTLDDAAIGTARRVYRDIGMQRLRGFVCEPVLTDSGYAGVAAHFVAENPGPDGDRPIWTVSAVTPGDQAAVRAAYRSSIDLGQLAAPIHEVVRGGLLLAPGTGSADHRLGRGKDVRASLREPSTDPWPDLPGWWTGRAVLAGMIDADPYPQLRLAPTEHSTPPPVVGLSATAWALDPMAFGVLAALTDEVEVILRADGDGWLLVAIDCPGWQVAQRPVFPGLDRLRAAELGSPVLTRELPETDADFTPADHSPEAVLARWAMQVALRGRRAVTGAGTKLVEDQRWLEAHASPHRAAVLGRLDAACRAGRTTFDGSFVPDTGELLTAWLAVAVG